MNVVVRASMAAAVALSLAACHHGAMPTLAAGQAATGANTLTAAEQRAGWKLLFDGTTTTGWRGYKMTTMPALWTVENGTLGKSRGTQDIVTTQTFTNFELTLEWKIGPGGNSGIFYRGTEEYDHVYWSAPEYQLADDSLTPDSKDLNTSVASIYGFYPSKRGINHRANEWNTTRIVVNGAHVEHWLNGTLIASCEEWSPEFTAKYEKSKFKPYPNFARAKSGFIAIQGDHPGTLALRNIKIRELK